MTNEHDLTNENELSIIGYKNWLNEKMMRENESFEVSRLRFDLELLTIKVSQLENEISRINNEF